MSPSVEKITGYPLNRFYNNRGYGLSLCHPDDKERVLSEIQGVLSGTTGSLLNLEFRIIHKQGQVAWLSLEVLPIIQENTIVGIEGFCRDITERKRLDELKDNLIRDVTHELKTPVAKIEMALDMFRRSLLSGNKSIPGRECQIDDILKNNINRLKNAIKNILDISKLEAGMEPLRLSDISLAELSKIIVNELGKEAEKKGNIFTCEIPSDIPAIRADREKIHHLMFHLADNAIKFTEKGKIRISARQIPHGVELTVEDTGKGLEGGIRERIFDKFYKEAPSMYGSGIGLAICKNIVQIHKGKIWAESEGKGKGTRFKVVLPING